MNDVCINVPSLHVGCMSSRDGTCRASLAVYLNATISFKLVNSCIQVFELRCVKATSSSALKDILQSERRKVDFFREKPCSEMVNYT